MTRVAILGCGYVGCELGRRLADADDHAIWGVRRSESGLDAIERAGIEPVQADITEKDSLEAVPDVDWVVFAASAGGRDAEAARETYVEGVASAIEAFGERGRSPERFVYTGSTGVYGDFGGSEVDEGTEIDPATERQEILLEAERRALELTGEYEMAGTVARFGGLYGPDRYRLERYLEGPVTEGHLNLLHRDDAAGAVAFLVEQTEDLGEVVNVVDDEPVSKHRLADWLAAECGVEEPEKRTVEERLADEDLSEAAKARIAADKRCSNGKLRGLGYDFAYPTYREGYRDAIEAYRD
ncbi:NAD(P)-dependent oxidoreductase [Halobacteriales archaeon QS_3_64_16]|nr:MAG: NAD(P)-dependent oxidoreductase [Halobacteriales archaeon QS_3_64_16]